MEYFEFIQSYKRRTNVMTRCRVPEFCERYKIDIGIYDPKSKRIFPRTVIKQRDICVHIKIIIVLFGKKIDEIISSTPLIRYRFPKHETIDQLENVFVFDLET